ncbi:MAG: polysaccharide deacetylase, partial [Actinomycetota bacterium]
MNVRESDYCSPGLRYRYQPIVDRPEFMWPGDAAVAVWVIPNVEYYPYDKPGASVNDRAAAAMPDVLNHSWRDYGVRVGIWRLLECFDEIGVKVSATLNSDVCDEYPRLIEEGAKRGWEWIGHGTNNSMRLQSMSESEETELVKNVLDRIEQGVGVRPRGWLGPGLSESHNTLDILQRRGVEYVCDWVADDLPFWMEAGGGRILSVPYSIEMNDMELVLRQRLTGPEYQQRLLDQYEQLRAEGIRQNRGRVMAIPVHPFLMGQAHRIRYLADALGEIAANGDTWLATG